MVNRFDSSNWLKWATAVAFCSLILASQPQAQVARALARSSSACRHSNQVSASTSVGSQVDGDVVTICLSKQQLKLLQPKPVLKPAPKPGVKTPIKPSPKPSPKASPKLAAKAAPKRAAPTPKPRPRPIGTKRPSKIIRTGNGNTGVFRPSVASLTATPAQAKPDQLVIFSTNQPIQFGHTTLLGNRVLVRFTPVQLDLDFGDQKGATASTGVRRWQHSYIPAGEYFAMLHVTYRVEYRLATGKWFRDPDTITLAPEQVAIRVGDTASETTAKKVVLVPPIG